MLKTVGTKKRFDMLKKKGTNSILNMKAMLFMGMSRTVFYTLGFDMLFSSGAS